jgi:hypothetical protein
MSEDIKTARGGSIPGRLVVTLAPNAVETARQRVAASRQKRVPSALRVTGVEALDRRLKEFGVKTIRPVTGRRRFERLVRVRLDRRLILEFPPGADLRAIAAALRELPEVERVEEDPRLATDQDTPDDPNYTDGTQWHLGQISIEGAWTRSKGSGVIIGVYDSNGVRTGHPDLSGNYVSTPCDGDGDAVSGEHGTQVVGVCAAVTDNATGVAGAGWNARFMAVKAGGGTTSAAATECMVDEGADLIVTSSPAKQDDEPSALGDAVDYAFEAGVPVIASAGNDNHPTESIPYDQWPAKNSRALAVGNTEADDTRRTTSNYGPWLDVMAPGVSIQTTSGASGYAAPTGTSFSTPLVGGVAALMLARNRTIGPRQLYELLRQTTILPAGTDTSDNRYGNGRIEANKAMNATSGLWKAVRYGSAPAIGASVAISSTGWWIVGYSKSVFVGYRSSFWEKRVVYDSVADARPAVAINDSGDWIACYSRSTFVGNGIGTVKKMVTYPRRTTPGAVAINAAGDWIACYSLSCFVGHKTSSSKKVVTYNAVPVVAGDVAINDRGDWICCYSKSTFVGFKTSSASKMVTYNEVAPARPAVAINAGGDWIVNYSKSTFVGFRTSSSSKMVTYPRREVPGDVAINNAGQWVATYSLSTFVGEGRSWASKRVTYDAVPQAAAAVGINEPGDWIASYSRTTFLGNMLRSNVQAVRHAPDDMSKRDIENGASFPSSALPGGPGAVGINGVGDWVVCYGRSATVGTRAVFTNTNRFD